MSTDVEPTASTAVAIKGVASGIEGLEDFEASDMIMPRLGIDHDTNQFEDNLSKQKYDTLTVVLLGLIKQRILWPAKQGDDDKPLCKSYDHNIGFPNPSEFPWEASSFDKQDGEAGTIQLPCEGCSLKDWGSHPVNDSPWCSEQHSFALLQVIEDENGEIVMAPAIFTAQRTGLSSSKSYLTSFVRQKAPLYTAQTVMSLEQRKRGKNEFSVVQFMRGPATDESQWPEFAASYRSIREFLQTPRTGESGEPGGDDDDTTTPASNEHTGPAAEATAEPATAAAPKDDDLPF